MLTKIPITKQGLIKLQEELKYLKQIKRPNIIKNIVSAREFGDLSENAEYHAAKEEQGLNESRILYLEDKLARSHVVDVKKLSGNKIQFGATVKLLEEQKDQIITYQIVSEYEADIAQKKISILSPIAKALIGKLIDEEVEVHTPNGIKSYKIIDVIYI